MSKRKVGLLGVGGITLRHIPVWLKHEDAELVAMCDIRPEQMEPIRRSATIPIIMR